MRQLLTSFILCVSLLSTTGRQSVLAEDYFLTIGGGYSPTGNQISLEKNVFFFRSLLDNVYDEAPSHQVFFADGNDPGRDLQYSDTENGLPRANQLLAQIHRQTKHLSYRYRDNQIDDLYGASNKQNLRDWFDKIGAGLESGDRLFIYATAHGGRGSDRGDPTNTRLFLWNNESISVREMESLLDKVQVDVPVVLVMVQCYSGGFADLIFDNGNSDDGLSSANRCGFFATVHDRVAAGCTADIREEDYHEYSTYFIAALLGQSRTGSPVERPDFNHDGEISFEEAHAYALIESTTIDISIKTSDVFLREYSRLEGSDQENLLDGHSPIDQLLGYASECDRIVVERLSASLELTGDDRYREAEQLADRLMRDKRSVSRQKRRLSGELNNAGDAIKKSVLAQWPELANSWNPEAQRLVLEEGESIVEFIEQHHRYDDFSRARQQLANISAQETDFDRRWVRCKRLMRALETVALAANLETVGDEETLERFRRLQLSERQSLGAQPEPSAVTTASRD